MHRVRQLTNQLKEESKVDDTKLSKQSVHHCCGNSNSFYKPVKVVVTGAAGNIAYAILFGIGRGKLLGENTPIDLVLLDIPPMADKLNGVVMELNDCAFPLLSNITATTDYQVGFTGVEIALLIGAKPRGPGMVRADLLKSNAKIFEGQGKALEEYASRNVKVCVVGNPANTNALITMKNAPSIPKENFTAMTRLDQNRAASQLATRLNVSVSDVRNVIIWGNHSKTQYPDINHAYVSNYPRKNLQTSVRSAVKNDNWVENEFVPTVQQRGAAIIKARGASSAASAASACLDHVRDWMLGTQQGEIVSMGVVSDGSYGVPKDIIYSFPVTCSNGNYQIVTDLPVDDRSRQLMDATAKELLEERQSALGN